MLQKMWRSGLEILMPVSMEGAVLWVSTPLSSGRAPDRLALQYKERSVNAMQK
jgi:hypothetical protein